MRRRGARPVGLSERLDLLDEALELADGHVEPAVLDEVRAVRARVDERLARGDQVVVTAFAGGTGTGKSSLFNAVAGERIAEVGLRRPTTDEPQAVVAGDLDRATPLLDWLEVRRRHVTDPDGLPEGLVLVDLPDHDSVVTAHHAVSARFVERVDLLVWVVDPLKYARRDFHHEALRLLAEHAEVLVVVMNHADQLSPEGRRACAQDLRRLLDAEGLEDARLLVTSARTQEGIPALRTLVVEEARRRHAMAARVAGDLRAAAKRLRSAVFGVLPAPDAETLDVSGLVVALAAAAGVDGRAEAAAADYRASALAGSRPWITGLLAVLWTLARRAVTGARSLLERPDAGQAATPGGAAPVAVRHAQLELVDGLAEGLPRPARDRLARAAGADPDALGRTVGAAVDAVPLRPDRRRWWTLVGAVLTAVEVMALVGAGWLMLAGLVDWLRLPELPTPPVAGELPWPTALLLGGLIVRMAGGIGRRRMAALAAQRHAAAVRSRLHDALEETVAEHVTDPLRAELDRLARLDEALGRAAS